MRVDFLARSIRAVATVFAVSTALSVVAGGERLPSPSPAPGDYLKKNPAADTDGDGKLSPGEYSAYSVKKVLEKLPDGPRRHLSVMLPARDGVFLATEIFIPNGKGPWPVAICRSAYGRFNAAEYFIDRYRYDGVVYATQDLRGDGGSEGQGTRDLKSFDNEIDDGYDTVEWLAKQPWCDGRVGMFGQSGHGFAAYMAMLASPPHLTVVDTLVSGGNAYLYWTFHNGVRREMYNWLSNRNIPIPQWPRPTIALFDRPAYDALVEKQARDNKTVMIARTGWYDIFLESSLDYFAAFGKNGRVFVEVDAVGHGAMAGMPYPRATIPKDAVLPDFIGVLKGTAKVPEKSRLVYYLLGDCQAKNAPGNVYRVSNVWPVPAEDRAYYLSKDGGLSPTPPADKDAALSFVYDPANPAPSTGGDVYIHKGVGPKDQRVLKERKDILRFASAPLAAPLTITGKVRAELFVKSDAPDTTFTVKLVDIYPDGYEAIVRDSIAMTRYRDGLDRAAPPLEKDKIYKLSLDLWSIALVFNKGHRLGVEVSSSNAPKYEVHPNTYVPAASPKDFRKAANAVMMAADFPSKIIVPVTKGQP